MYEGAGYDFLFRTDHWVASREPETSDPNRLLWINGIELDGVDRDGASYDVVCLGDFTDLAPQMGLQAGIESAIGQGGLTILAHPYWTGNSLHEALKHPFDGVEIYNHVGGWLNGKSDAVFLWDAMLEQGRNILAFAADDIHMQPEYDCWNGGWIEVNAKARTTLEIMTAIRAGNFYSSCGPSFYNLECDGRKIHVAASPVRAIRLVGPRGMGVHQGHWKNGTITQATFDIPSDWSYARLEIVDELGRKAWSNSLFSGK